MKLTLWKAACVCLCLLATSVLSAQEITDAGLKKAISDSLTAYLRTQTTGKTTVKTIECNKKEKTVTVSMDEYLAYFPMKEADVQNIYRCIQKMMPDSLQKFHLSIASDGKTLEELVPNAYRAQTRKDKSRIFNNKDNKVPLVQRISEPYKIQSGLQNKHIAMWQSHGFYYEQKLARWEWQRARIFQTVEDLYTQSYVLPYLVPMLENAGANVLLPRERDYHSVEVIVDNDASANGSLYKENNGKEAWKDGDGSGFANKKTIYQDWENPFTMGSFRQAATVKKGAFSEVSWTPDMPEKGRYAVYVSYKSLPNSADDALYTVYHLGGKSEFKVNQTMGGGTWIFLGFFSFDKGKNDACKITLSNKSAHKECVVTADAVKIGGGMGNIARMPDPNGNVTENVKSSDGATPQKVETALPIHYTPEISGYPRYTEGARYWLQWAGFPDSIYSRSHGTNDYTDDYQSRGFWVNYLAGGSKVLPKSEGLHVPVDLAFAFHSDAGTTYNDDIIGTLGIYMTHHNNEVYENGQSRWAARDLTNLVMDEIVKDVRYYYEPNWTRRGMWNKSYSEARVPNVPTMLLELLSHQNFADMRYGLDPRFRFTVSRSIYKGMLKFIAGQYNYPCVVQPLPVEAFSSRFAGDTQVALSWQAVNDPMEASAKPSKYVLYTRVGDGDFDNGKLVNDTACQVVVEKDKIYSFKVTAVNDGGESFPSEILSVCRKSNEKGVAMIVNGFTRVSAPFSFAAKDSLGGFVDFIDHGVPDKEQYNYIGSMYEFRRQIPWMDDDSSGFGGSQGNHETQVIAGNSFDYPAIHGRALAEGGYSFVSTSKQAVTTCRADLSGYAILDLILGKEKEWTVARGAKPTEFKAFPIELQAAITDYCMKGGNLLISGAYVGTDLWDNPNSTKADRAWAQNILKFQWRNDAGAVTGRMKAVASPFPVFAGKYNYFNELNSESYVVERPDAIEPAGKDSYTIFRYSENNLSAGVAYKGDYSTCILGVPFEAIKPEGRSALMKGILGFFEQKIKQAEMSH
jgi:hypothetical protein